MPFQYKITIQNGPEIGKTFILDKMELFLGREPGNDIMVNDPEVSRKHARLKKIGTQYLLEDLGSTNGTFLQGNRVSLPVMLQSGDEIMIGERVILRYEMTEFDPNATIASPRREVVSPAAPQAQPDIAKQSYVEPFITEMPSRQVVGPTIAPEINAQPIRPTAQEQPPVLPVQHAEQAAQPRSVQVNPPAPVSPVRPAPEPTYTGKTPAQPEATKKRSSLVIVLLIILGVILVFCVIPWIIIDITNSYCLFLPGIFNAIQPGVCP